VPVQSTIHTELRIVIGRAWGYVTAAEIAAHQDKLLADPSFNPDFNQLMDASKMTDWQVSIDDAQTAARRKFFSPLSKRAFVKPHPTTSSVARVFESDVELTKKASKIELFSDVPSALEWLGLEALPGDHNCSCNGVQTRLHSNPRRRGPA